MGDGDETRALESLFDGDCWCPFWFGIRRCTMTVLDKIKSFFRRPKAETKAEEPKPAMQVAEKGAPEAPEKKA